MRAGQLQEGGSLRGGCLREEDLRAEKMDAALSPDYGPLLEEIKKRIRSAQIRAALSVNRELVLLYWEIGRRVLDAQKAEGWGAKVVDRLADDLRRAFPDMKGLSRSNLLYMRAFAEAWPEESIVQQVVGQIPWGHNVSLLDKLKSPEEHLWYARAAVEQIEGELSQAEE